MDTSLIGTIKKIVPMQYAMYLVFCFNANAQNLIRIPQDVNTLSAAVQLALSGDTILLAPGLYTDSVHISSKHLIIIGDPSGGSVFSPGMNQMSFVLQDADIEFQYIAFDDFQLNSSPPNFAITSNFSNVKIDHCWFTNLYTPISSYWGNLVISHSIFSGIRGSGVIHHNGGTFVVYNNLIYGIDQTGIVINRANGQFFNNTLVGSSATQYRGVIINSDAVSHIYNNVISRFGVGVQLIASDSVEMSALRIYNNNIYGVRAPYRYEYNENLSFPIYSGALTPHPGTGEIAVPANFIDPTAGNFMLHSNSPCIDAGTNAYPFFVHFDLGGSNRVAGATPDIGAFEYSVATADDNSALNEQIVAVEIYPQPCNDHVWVYFENSYTGAIEVMDISGKVVTRLKLHDTLKTKVDLPEQSGMYLLSLVNSKGRVVKRVLKHNK